MSKNPEQLHLVRSIIESSGEKISERHATNIVPGIWLGNVISAQDRDFLNRYQIGCIINVSTIEYDKGSLEYYQIPLEDSDACNTDLSELLMSGADMIDKALRENKVVLIHCKKGHHRSASVLALYLVKYQNMDLPQAIYYIKQFRPNAFRRMACVVQTLNEF